VIAVRKLLGLTVGAAALALAVLLVRRLTRESGRLTPKTVADSAAAALSDLTAAVQGFATDVRQGMAEHEATLREATELDGGHLGRTDTP
jgi:hypothetical protein